MSISQSLYGHLIEFFISLGADNELPSDKAQRISYVNEFHNKVAVNNPLWPENLPFGYVYAAFVNAVIYDRTELKGHNIGAFVKAFKGWITQGGVEENLRKAYYRENPDKAPKQLQGRDQQESEETKQIIADGYVDEPPSTVRRLIGIYDNGYGSIKAALDDTKEMDNYRRRLYATKQKYIDEGRWPES